MACTTLLGCGAHRVVLDQGGPGAAGEFSVDAIAGGTGRCLEKGAVGRAGIVRRLDIDGGFDVDDIQGCDTTKIHV